MRREEGPDGTFSDPTTVLYTRCSVDLTNQTTTLTEVRCQNLEDLLGGFGRSFQILANHDVSDPFSPRSPLIVNTGILTGTNVMTGLRTYFSAYSPLKVSNKGLPAAMWSAGSGKFGSKLRWSGVDELLIEGRATEPMLLVIRGTEHGPTAALEPASHLLGLYCYKKILGLHREYTDGHFAVIGPAGEQYDHCYFAAVGLSTENLLKSGDDKCRWAGRGGMGSVMGSKNLLGIVAECPDRRTQLAPEIRATNREIATGPGSRKFREADRGGLGGTWANYEPLDAFSFVPQLNFRPTGDDRTQRMYRGVVEPEFVIKAESCFKCGINCHKNIYERQAGWRGGRVSRQVRLRAAQSALDERRSG